MRFVWSPRFILPTELMDEERPTDEERVKALAHELVESTLLYGDLTWREIAVAFATATHALAEIHRSEHDLKPDEVKKLRELMADVIAKGLSSKTE